MNAAVGALALLLSVAAPSASAATSVAISNGLSSVAYAGTGQTIELADRYALAICEVETRKRGVVPACRVFGHTETVGWYAVACGQLGCGASIGKTSLRLAQEGAFQECYKQQKFCYTELVAFGSDLPGAAQKPQSSELPDIYRAKPGQ